MKPTLKQISPLLLEFEWNSPITDELLQQQLNLQSKLKENFTSKISELRMGFNTLAVVLSSKLDPLALREWLHSTSFTGSLLPLPEKIWQIPVCYSEETGRDLLAFTKMKGISEEELISLHATPIYRLHFYGFLPGFMYLNGLPKELHAARKTVPDQNVPIGSVAIGAAQTGIYPSSSPGGWHLIGQTPLILFNPSKINPVYAAVGEQIEFLPITAKEFYLLKRHPQEPKTR